MDCERRALHITPSNGYTQGGTPETFVPKDHPLRAIRNGLRFVGLPLSSWWKIGNVDYLNSSDARENST